MFLTERRIRSECASGMPASYLRFRPKAARPPSFDPVKLRRTPFCIPKQRFGEKVEARVGIEPTIKDLQSSALPLGYRAISIFDKEKALPERQVLN